MDLWSQNERTINMAFIRSTSGRDRVKRRQSQEEVESGRERVTVTVRRSRLNPGTETYDQIGFEIFRETFVINKSVSIFCLSRCRFVNGHRSFTRSR